MQNFVVPMVVGALLLWLSLVITYLIIKAAVRNGLIEANRKMSQPVIHHSARGKDADTPRDLASLFQL